MLTLPRADVSYNYEQHPVVTSLSKATSGTNGGFVLTVTGSGFAANCADNIIRAAGVPCVPTACSLTSLTCTLGAVAEQSVAEESPRGMDVMLFDRSQSITDTPAGESVQTAALVGLADNFDNSYQQVRCGGGSCLRTACML